MRPSPEGPKCPKCNTIGVGATISTRAEGKDVVVRTEESEGTLPTTEDFPCPECGNGEAYFVYRQTRAADEPTTIILQCTKCKHKWRKY